MSLNRTEIEALHRAAASRNGCIVLSDPPMGLLEIVAQDGFDPLPLGKGNLDHLLDLGLLRCEGGNTYVLTERGRGTIARG